MTDRGLTRPERPAPTAGRVFLRQLGVILVLPFWLAWLLLALLLPFGRAFVQFPLALVTIGGFGIGIFFSLHHAWGDALTAALIGGFAAAALAAFTALAERIDPDFSRPIVWPPFWWYF